MNPVIIRDNY